MKLERNEEKTSVIKFLKKSSEETALQLFLIKDKCPYLLFVLNRIFLKTQEIKESAMLKSLIKEIQ